MSENKNFTPNSLQIHSLKSERFHSFFYRPTSFSTWYIGEHENVYTVLLILLSIS